MLYLIKLESVLCLDSRGALNKFIPWLILDHKPDTSKVNLEIIRTWPTLSGTDLAVIKANLKWDETEWKTFVSDTCYLNPKVLKLMEDTEDPVFLSKVARKLINKL